ncbi:hypothetical protein MTX78_23205 (plasmid) [Hymenobacter tibetensis]|uniref:Uncharacterized protein n=1 Tax=Hymenobacter tibetensis TaxID=497967 RepID=A0ABY4D4Q2_9BACT|nr:hypothetical protein [Hymenobacter tibetensis]UOG77338.1 hypothetical protein MTX78_23205 [Hymenobacter tibetensis]
MIAKKKNPQTVVLDASLAEQVDDIEISEYNSDATDQADDVVAALCPHCGELLAWHEEACVSAAVPVLMMQPHEMEAPPDAPLPLTPSPFTYAVGQLVQPAPATQAGKIIWRGQVKERHTRTGLLRRVNVYRLDNGYWDCYYEAELQAA